VALLKRVSFVNIRIVSILDLFPFCMVQAQNLLSTVMNPSSTSIDFFPTDYPGTQDAGQAQNFPNPYITSQPSSNNNFGGNSSSFEDEPPLWEELGFDPDFIKTKLLTLLLPGRKKNIDEKIIQDSDLGGPFIFCILLGFCLVLQGGKFHFGYIFGYSILGGIAMYILLNLMSEQVIGVSHTMSVLGYCLVPMIVLALTSIAFPPSSMIGFALAVASIAYCTHSASAMFMKVLQTADQRFLFAYPIGLLYACFALIVIF